MEPDQLTTLMEKYLDGTLTGPEEQVLRDWYRDNEAGEVIWNSDSADERNRVQDRILARLQKDIQQTGTGHVIIPMRRRRIWMAAAAIGIVLLSGTAYLLPNLWSKGPVAAGGPVATKVPLAADLLPATNKATLLLSNGNAIVLDSAGNGVLAEEGGARVKKTAQGQLVYQAGTKPASDPGSGGGPGAPAMNTVTTPRGGRYHLVLADGSKVWLNAASSISYPAVFIGRERVVTVTGEVYFEVSPDKSRPFKVQTREETIDVLGTSFNVNVYADEPVRRVTLETGSVKVNAGQQALVLRPGEQTLHSDKGFGKTDKADMEGELAWKNGDFVFNNEDLSSILRELSRWYNIDISYKGSPGPMAFDGIISRSKNLSAVLQIMESSTKKIHFQIENRRLMVITNP